MRSTLKHRSLHQEIRSFDLLVAENKSKFSEQLQTILQECKTLFPEISFETTVINDPAAFRLKDTEHIDLVFMEDDFLLHTSPQTEPEHGMKQDIILLLNGHFVGEEGFQLKKIVQENWLHLSGHLSLTNYSFNLIRLLVIDFIKTKIRYNQRIYQ